MKLLLLACVLAVGNLTAAPTPEPSFAGLEGDSTKSLAYRITSSGEDAPTKEYLQELFDKSAKENGIGTEPAKPETDSPRLEVSLENQDEAFLVRIIFKRKVTFSANGKTYEDEANVWDHTWLMAHPSTEEFEKEFSQNLSRFFYEYSGYAELDAYHKANSYEDERD